MFGKRNQSTSVFRILLALTVIGHLLLSSAMAFSPSLHEAVHCHSHDADHECAATLFASGSVDGPVAIVLCAVYLRTDVIESVILPELDLQSIFQAGGVLEHAPPVLS